MKASMKKAFTLFLTIVCFSFSSHSLFGTTDSYSLLIQEAKEKFEHKQYEEAAKLGEEAFALRPEESTDLIYYSACARALIGDSIGAFIDLNKAIDNGWSNFKGLIADKDLESLHNKIQWQELIAKIEIQNHRKAEVYFIGAYFGIMLILLVYNLLLYFSIKDRALLYYALFIFFAINLQVFYTPGFGGPLYKIFPWLHYATLMYRPFIFFISLDLVCLLLFVRNFLDFKSRFKRIDQILVFLIFYSAFTALISIHDFGFPQFFFRPYPVLIIVLFIFSASIVRWVKGYKPAKYFVIANTALTAGYTIAIIAIMSGAKTSVKLYIFTPDQIGFVLFLALLSFAIGDKINTLKTETIQAQEKAMEILEEKVQERTVEVVKQKEIIEEKNKDINDSITYAQRIQHAILPSREEINSAFPQSLLLFKPKDIVSGDFYFFHQTGSSVFIAAADCTGHGVPGALMSMVGSEQLNDAVSKSTEPSEILQLLNKGIKSSLRQTDSDDSTRDGMDIAFCSVDLQKRRVQYAGANRPLWIIRKGAAELEEIKATKHAIGGLTQDGQEFETHEFNFNKGDTFYITTDGYADQFSELDKKLTTKKFKQLLLQLREHTMQEQESRLSEFMESWRGRTEQIDDVLVIGIRL